MAVKVGGRKPSPASPAGQRGVVVKAPAAIGRVLHVSFAGVDKRYATEIDRWEAHGATLPSVGDECLVVYDDHGDPWVAAWVAT